MSVVSFRPNGRRLNPNSSFLAANSSPPEQHGAAARLYKYVEGTTGARFVRLTDRTEGDPNMNSMKSKILMGAATLMACVYCTTAIAAPQKGHQHDKEHQHSKDHQHSGDHDHDHDGKHVKHEKHEKHVKHVKKTKGVPASVTHSKPHSTNSYSKHGTAYTTNPGHTKPKDDVDKASRQTNKYVNGASKNVNHEANRESKDFNHGVNKGSKAVNHSVNKLSKDINHAFQGKKKKQ
jgi:hypothetical protein